MFCPRCGQQQLSDEVRFCSRCGLPLGAVARLVEDGGLTETAAEGVPRGLSPRQRGMRKGLLVMAAAFMLGLITIFLTLLKEDFFVLLFVAALGFTFGVIRMLYGMLLEDDAPPKRVESAAWGETRSALEGARSSQSALPPARPFHTPDPARPRAQTAEMQTPVSVTEGTTRLLEDNEK